MSMNIYNNNTMHCWLYMWSVPCKSVGACHWSERLNTSYAVDDERGGGGEIENKTYIFPHTEHRVNSL